jgi:hypothetical protein
LIEPDCDRVAEKRKAANKARRQRKATSAMKAANALNGAKGKGKKSEAGRIASSRNSLRHGMACKTFIFLKDEDPNEFWSAVDQRIKEEGVTSQLEKDLIATIVYSRWTWRRAINANASAINEEREAICDRFEDGNVQQMRELIDLIPTAPDIAVDELSKSTCGCVFLIGQFKLIDQRLDAYYSTEVSQRGEALRLGGHRPDELFMDQDVFDFNKAYFGGISGTAGFTADEAANALQFDKPKAMGYPELVRRLEPLVKDIPSLDEGRRRMKAYIAAEIARLTERQELVGYREERRLAAALSEAQGPVDRAAVTRARYVNDSDRTLFAGVRVLLALKKERRQYGDVDPEAPSDDGVTGETVAGPADCCEPRADQPNDDLTRAPEVAVPTVVEAPPEPAEPAASRPDSERSGGPEVVGPIGTKDSTPADPALAAAAPDETGLDPLEALIAKYNKVIDDLR